MTSTCLGGPLTLAIAPRSWRYRTHISRHRKYDLSGMSLTLLVFYPIKYSLSAIPDIMIVCISLGSIDMLTLDGDLNFHITGYFI
ncbi:MAG: hypothetical protein QXS23_05720 [Desulfurococcaceae archaeon]